MRVNRVGSLGAIVIALAISSCAPPPPKRPLAPGYYVQNDPGVTRRIIVTAGERHASYDVWRVSTNGDGTAWHAHYDLVAADDVPSSGDFAITQDGSDCGTFSIQPYRFRGGVDDGILTVRYGTLGIERFRVLPGGDAARYHEYDQALLRHIVQVASDNPHLYGQLHLLGKFFYGELNPSCIYDQ